MVVLPAGVGENDTMTLGSSGLGEKSCQNGFCAREWQG